MHDDVGGIAEQRSEALFALAQCELGLLQVADVAPRDRDAVVDLHDLLAQPRRPDVGVGDRVLAGLGPARVEDAHVALQQAPLVTRGEVLGDQLADQVLARPTKELAHVLVRVREPEVDDDAVRVATGFEDHERVEAGLARGAEAVFARVQRIFRPALLGDVLGVRHDVGDRPVPVAGRGHVDARPHDAAVRMHEPGLGYVGVGLAREQRIDPSLGGVAIVRVRRLDVRGRVDLVATAAEQPAHRVVHVDEALAGVRDRNAHGCVLERDAKRVGAPRCCVAASRLPRGVDCLCHASPVPPLVAPRTTVRGRQPMMPAERRLHQSEFPRR